MTYIPTYKDTEAQRGEGTSQWPHSHEINCRAYNHCAMQLSAMLPLGTRDPVGIPAVPGGKWDWMVLSSFYNEFYKLLSEVTWLAQNQPMSRSGIITPGGFGFHCTLRGC